ncbi:serine hydrolase domain-containing protein [Streptomyces sp. NPDC052023]|uniref:serine hydrolase domain-containing protein n=1 Tax=Streptomyces sp. NPDC052023 TaxID=3365681 RepID=UPI0037D36173
MTGPRAPWPGAPSDTEAPRAAATAATVQPPPAQAVTWEEDGRLARLLEDAVALSDAPDVVFAATRHGRRTLRSGGTAPPPPRLREDLRYEIGSATKTFTGLLLTHLVHSGRLTGGEPALTLLAPGRETGAAPVTLAHLMTHTSGLPALPRDFYLRAMSAWHTNPYARYPAARVVGAFLRHHPRHRPGSRWHYSNFGVAVLGHALAPAVGAPWEDLLTEHVLRPLRLHGIALRPNGPQGDAVGHTKDGTGTLPAFDAGGFAAAGAVRATPHDLLTFLEAHLDPGDSPLAGALHAVRTPVLRRGLDHRHVHTVAWFRHPTAGGPLYFHSGATLGQQAFLGFRPDTGTAVAALCTRRFRAGDPFVAAAYALLAEE